MKYYTIQNNGLLIADKKETLEKFYNNVLELPLDYKDGKYVIQNGVLVLNLNYEVEELRKKKEEKLKQNEIIRDNALNYGVKYKGILFDSDTDQKVNLIDTYSRLKDNQTVTWLGKNNEPLECTKEDLNNIGNLIREKTSMIWMVNAQIKEEIAGAKSVEELDRIEIGY